MKPTLKSTINGLKYDINHYKLVKEDEHIPAQEVAEMLEHYLENLESIKQQFPKILWG